MSLIKQKGLLKVTGDGGGGGGDTITGDAFAGISDLTIPSNSLPGATIVADVQPTISGVVSIFDDAFHAITTDGTGLQVGVEPPVYGDTVDASIQVISSDSLELLRKKATLTVEALSGLPLADLAASQTDVLAGLGPKFEICTFSGRWTSESHISSRFKLCSDDSGTPYAGAKLELEDMARLDSSDLRLRLLTGSSAFGVGDTESVYVQENAGGQIKYSGPFTFTGLTPVAPSDPVCSVPSPSVHSFDHPFAEVLGVLSATVIGNDKPTWRVDRTAHDGGLMMIDVYARTGEIVLFREPDKSVNSSLTINFIPTGSTGLDGAPLTLTIDVLDLDPHALLGSRLVADFDLVRGDLVATSGGNITSITDSKNGKVATPLGSSIPYTSGQYAAPDGSGSLHSTDSALVSLFGDFSSTTFGAQASAPFSIVFLGKTTSSQHDIVAVYSDGGGYDVCEVKVGTDGVGINFASIGAGAMTSGEDDVVIVSYDGAQGTVYLNGASVGNTGTININVLETEAGDGHFTLFGSNKTSGSDGLPCTWRRTMILNAPMTDEEASQISRYLKGYHGISTAQASAPTFDPTGREIILEECFLDPDESSYYDVNGGWFTPTPPGAQCIKSGGGQTLLNSWFPDPTYAPNLAIPGVRPFRVDDHGLEMLVSRIPAHLLSLVGRNGPLNDDQDGYPDDVEDASYFIGMGAYFTTPHLTLPDGGAVLAVFDMDYTPGDYFDIMWTFGNYLVDAGEEIDPGEPRADGGHEFTVHSAATPNDDVAIYDDPDFSIATGRPGVWGSDLSESDVIWRLVDNIRTLSKPKPESYVGQSHPLFNTWGLCDAVKAPYWPAGQAPGSVPRKLRIRKIMILGPQS